MDICLSKRTPSSRSADVLAFWSQMALGNHPLINELSIKTSICRVFQVPFMIPGGYITGYCRFLDSFQIMTKHIQQRHVCVCFWETLPWRFASSRLVGCSCWPRFWGLGSCGKLGGLAGGFKSNHLNLIGWSVTFLVQLSWKEEDLQNLQLNDAFVVPNQHVWHPI